MVPLILLLAPQAIGEPPEAWQVADSNGSVRVSVNQAHPTGGPEGGPCQEFEIQAVNATYVHAICPIPPAYAIGEFRPRLWVRADRPRLQLFARVLLPHSQHPESGRPLMALVPGTTSRRTDHWERLEVGDLRPKLLDQVQILRTRFGPEVTAAGAYVDALVMNVYGGPGRTRVWLANVELEGAVLRPAQEPTAGRPVDVRIAAGRFEINGRPQFIRAAPLGQLTLEELAQAGVNTVVLPQGITAELAAQAEQLGLWIVAPPPSDSQGPQSPGSPGSPVHARVIAWQLSPGQTPPDRRPVLIPPGGLPGPVDHSAIRLVGPDPPSGRWPDEGVTPGIRATDIGWAIVRLAPDPVAVAQARALMGPDVPSFQPTQNQLHQRLVAAVVQGVRGVWFDTEGLRPDDAQRWQPAFQELNAYLQLWHPWLAAGQRESPLRTSSAQMLLASWTTPESRLLLPVRRHAGPTLQLPLDQVSFTLPSAHESEEVYRVAFSGLAPVEHHRTAGGQRVLLENVTVQTTLVASPRRATIQQLARQMARRQAETVPVQRARLDSQWQALGAVVPEEWRDGSSFDILLRRLSRRIDEGDYRSASELVERADGELLKLCSRLCLTAGARVAATNPVSYYPQTLPAAELLVRVLQERRPTGNQLPHGNCEDLQAMGEAGWQAGPATAASLGLDRRLRREGRSALCLENQSAHDGQTVWIQSPPVSVDPGDVVKITAWVRVTHEPGTPQVVGSVYCSLAGSQSVWRTWSANQWEPFSFITVVDRSAPLDVSFALEGRGRMVIDQVQILRYPPHQPLERLAEVR